LTAAFVFNIVCTRVSCIRRSAETHLDSFLIEVSQAEQRRTDYDISGSQRDIAGARYSKKPMLTNRIPKDVHWIAEMTESNFFLRSRIVNSFFIHCNSTNQPKSNANYGTGNDQQLKIS